MQASITKFTPHSTGFRLWGPMLFFLLLCASLARAQSTTVGGTVTDDGLGLPGVNVVVKGSTSGTVTDIDGRYSLTVDDPQAVLVFSYLGYSSQEIPVEGRTTVDVALNDNAEALDEVVVIGYGTVKKSDVTGAVISLKAEELTPGANVSVEQMLQGRAAGVFINQNSGEPGSGMSIKIRGASSITAGNEPLYVIDGMPVNNGAVLTGTGAGFVGSNNPRNPLNALNPNDIASIEVLKDASATAIYGSRGANGVILVTTKGGAEGSLRVTYDGYYGQQTIANQLDLLSPTEYRDVLNGIIEEGGGTAGERVTEIDGGGTEWQDQLFRSAPMQNHNLAFSGGAGDTRYYASLNYFDQQGVVISSGIKRYNARLNLESKKSGEYGFGLNLNTTLIQNDFVSNGVGLNENGGALYAAINYDPTISIFEPNGTRYRRSEFITIDNPLALAYGEEAESEDNRTFGSIYGEYFFVPALSAKIKLAGDVNNSRRDAFINPLSLDGEQNGSIASILTGQRTYYLLEGTLNFNETFGKHSIGAVVGATKEFFGSEFFNGDGRGYTLPDLGVNAIGSGNQLLNNIGSGRQNATLQSVLGRMNYTLDDRYLLTLSFRADGSSRFGPNNRYGYFPSAAVAWKVHNEGFFNREGPVSTLKLRVSYGSIGNQAIGNYRFLSTFSTGRNVVLEQTQFTTLQPTRAENPNLKWEATNQLDIGVDLGFLEGRFTLSAEYFDSRTTDLLLNVPLPPSTGFGSRIDNVGSLRNSGLELMFGGSVVNTPVFDWTTNVNFTTIRNEVEDLGGAEQILTGGLGFVSNASIIRPGLPLNSYYGYEVGGVWQEGDDLSVTTDNVAPGDFKFVDQNGDGTISDADRVVLGDPFPDYTWGMSNTISAYNLSLSFYIEGVEGVSMLNNNLVDAYFPINFRRNKVAEPYLNRWTPSNPTNEYPSFVNPTAQGQRVVNSRTVEDASYIRLQSVRVGYDVPLGEGSRIRSLNVYVTGSNLLTITDYSGVDPAANAAGGNVLRIDYNSYPFARTFLLGANLSF